MTDFVSRTYAAKVAATDYRLPLERGEPSAISPEYLVARVRTSLNDAGRSVLREARIVRVHRAIVARHWPAHCIETYLRSRGILGSAESADE